MANKRALRRYRAWLGVLTLNAFFVMLFVVSGLLFRHAGEDAKTEPRAL